MVVVIAVNSSAGGGFSGIIGMIKMGYLIQF